MASLLALFCFTPSYAAEPAPAYVTPVQTLAAALKTGRIPQSVVNTVNKAGEVHVIVELQLAAPYVSEASLPKANVDVQRQAIRAAQDAVVVETLGQVPKAPKRMRSIPHMSMWGDARALTTLVQSKRVRRVVENKLMAVDLARSSTVVGSFQTQAALGLLASGQTVAILDTGVDATHPFLGGRVVSQACYSDGGGWFSSIDSVCPNGDDESTAPGSAAPCSFGSCDHGTHVAGIAAGNAFGQFSFSGVANNANIIAIQVFHRENDNDECGGTDAVLRAPCARAFTSDVVLGLERVYELRQQFDIAAANMSLGGGFYNDRTQCDDDNGSVRDIAANLWGVNIAPVAAAGNGADVRDSNGLLVGLMSGIASPACVSNVVSVGAVDDIDSIAIFSQFGNFLTMLAVGVDVDSSVPGGGFASKDGTSQAAPHVAGAFAALAGLNPNLSVTALRDRLVATGRLVTDARMSPNIVKPRLQLDAAVEAQEGKPLPPSGLRVVSVTGTTATLAWNDNSRSETSVKLFDGTWNTTIAGSGATSGTITRLSPNGRYTVSARACDAANVCSIASMPLSVQTLNTLPSTPINFRAGVVTTNSIEVRWDSQSVNPVTSFDIGHNTHPDGGYRTISPVSASARSWVFNNLNPNRGYTFWIVARNADGSSSQAGLTVKTLSLGPVPATPTDLHLCGTRGLETQCYGTGTVWTWRDNATDETRYEFEWSRALVSVPASQLLYSTDVLPANTRRHEASWPSGVPYYFRVRACNGAGCSPYSNTSSHTSP